MLQNRKMPVVLLPALKCDFEYCKRIYFEEMQWIIDQLHLDRAAHEVGFQQQWDPAQVHIIKHDGAKAGWLQTIPGEEALFVAQIFVARPFQRKGIGTEVMKGLIADAARANHPVRLNVVKINPARRLYERLGFRVTHEDDGKVYMKLDPDAGRTVPSPRTDSALPPALRTEKAS